MPHKVVVFPVTMDIDPASASNCNERHKSKDQNLGNSHIYFLYNANTAEPDPDMAA